MAKALINGDPMNFAGLAGRSPTASSLFTTTSQYRVVGILQTTTTNPLEFFLANTTTVQALGICLTNMTSGSANPINVRMFGICKAIAADTIAAGSWVQRSGAGQIGMRLAGLMATAVSLTTHINALGIALENGATNDYVTILVLPQLIEKPYAA